MVQQAVVLDLFPVTIHTKEVEGRGKCSEIVSLLMLDSF